MMIRWLIQSVVDHPDLSAIRPPVGLLSPREFGQYREFRSPRRRRDWLLGRWTAKRLIQTYIAAAHGFSPALASFTVAQDPSGAPYARSHHPALQGTCAGERIPLALTISHSHGYAFCALCAEGAARARLGADIELVEPRGESFAQEFFTHDEQVRLKAAPPAQTDLLTTATWSAKEAVLKATHRGLYGGLHADPRRVQCLLSPVRPRRWTPLRVEMQPEDRAQREELGPLRAWWRVLENRLLPNSFFVLTIAGCGVRL